MAEYVEMKGFLDGFTVKGDGHEVETVPEPEGADITETAELDNAMPKPADKGSNIKPSDNKTGSPSPTMSPELEEVAEKAEEDIADGYVADPQHLPGPGDREVKGYERFNEMVGKGIVVGTKSLDPYDIKGSMEMIEKNINAQFDAASDDLSPWMGVEKGLDDMTVFKGPSYANIVGKGDPEDMGVDEGLVDEAPENPTMEQASDDTKGVEGENDSTPQTEEAEKEDEDKSNAETGMVGEAEKKGWDGFNQGIATKGFHVEEKGIRDMLRAAGKVYSKRGGKEAAKALARSTGRKIKRGVEAAGKSAAGSVKRTASRTSGAVGGAAGAVSGRTREKLMDIGVGGKRGSRLRSMARGIVRRTGGKKEKYLGTGVLGAGALAAGGAGYGGYKYATKKKKK